MRIYAQIYVLFSLYQLAAVPTLWHPEQGERDGIWAWHRINRLFNWLPLAALIEKKIICMHGGIGRSINHVEQIENLQRPITMEAGSIVLMDLLWSVRVLAVKCCPL